MRQHGAAGQPWVDGPGPGRHEPRPGATDGAGGQLARPVVRQWTLCCTPGCADHGGVTASHPLTPDLVAADEGATCTVDRRLLLFVGPAAPGDADLALLLARSGWRCLWLPDSAAAQRAAVHAHFDAVVLRAESEGGPAPRDIDALRRALCCPVLVTAETADEIDEVMALELGADAWLAGALTARRLRAHLQAVLRPRDAAEPAPPRSLGLGRWSLDTLTQRLACQDQQVDLTALQVSLLRCLGEQAGRAVSRSALAEVAGGGRLLHARSVDVYVARLRRRLRDAHVKGLDIVAVRGRGYLLEPGVDPGPAAPPWPWQAGAGRPAEGLSPHGAVGVWRALGPQAPSARLVGRA